MKKIMLLFSIILTIPCISADSPTGWRIDGSGRYPTATPPLKWSAEQNIIWKTKMPDWSNAQLVPVGDLLFTNSEPDTLVCLDSKTGKILWTRTSSYEDIFGVDEVARMRKEVEGEAAPIRAEIAELEKKRNEMRRQMRESGDNKLRGRLRGLGLKLNQAKKRLNEVDPLNMPAMHRDNGYTSAVPVTDGKHIWSIYGNGVVSCFDLEGNRVWSKFLEKPTDRWGHCASPVVSDGKLIVHIKDVVALDTKTGEEKWRAPSEEGWGSPVITRIGDEPVVITATKADVFRLSDGKKLASELGGLAFSTPVIRDNTIYFVEGKARAMKIPDKIGDELMFEPIWESKIKGSRHYASSVVTDDLIYAVSREAWLSVLDRKTGELVYEKELGLNGDNTNSVYPSVSLAGKHVFIGFEEGVTLVIEPGREYKEVSQNNLEKYRGTPIFIGNRVYIRGLEHTWCIGES